MSIPQAGPCVLGLGVDLVELARFSEFLRRNENSLGEVFTAGELRLAGRFQRDLYLAVRWGLKEAVLKALGTGWGGGVAWTDVEALGRTLVPQVRLQGTAKLCAERAGARAVHGSVSHAGQCVIAVALLLR